MVKKILRQSPTGMSYLDADNLLHITGGALGVLALAIFSLENVIGLSPVTKALVLLIGFIFFLVLGRTLGDVMEKMTYLMALASFLGLVNYVNSLFTGMEFIIFASSSILLIGLGYLIRMDKLSPGRNETRAFLAAVLLLGMGGMIFDITTPSPTESLVLDNSTTEQGDRLLLGSVLVRNDFFLPRKFEMPEYRACLYDSKSSMHTKEVRVEELDILDGKVLKQLDLWVEKPENFRGSTELKIEKRNECSPGYANNTLVIVD